MTSCHRKEDTALLDLLIDTGLDALLDSLKMLPFLFGAYLLLEFLEHKAGGKLAGCLQKLGPFGPVGGAVLGCVPQCGFSVAASNLYAGRLITLGTLMAVFLSTSDEAVPILLAHPEQFSLLWKLLVIKAVLACICGIVIDLVIKLLHRGRKDDAPVFSEICDHCDCGHHGILRSALHHTASIFVFVLAVNLALGLVIALVGQDNVSSFLMGIRSFQPLIAGLIGLIPNCASSVILTELYLQGGLTFGSMIAGLTTGAGMGLVVLFQANHRHMKQNFAILAGLYAIGAAAGWILDLLALA